MANGFDGDFPDDVGGHRIVRRHLAIDRIGPGWHTPFRRSDPTSRSARRLDILLLHLARQIASLAYRRTHRFAQLL